MPSYVIISPVKDEARYVGETLKSMVAQTLRPSVWVIVDDGSRDGTGAILEGYANQFDFIRLVRMDVDGSRQPGGRVIRTFNRGLLELKDKDAAFLVKLDCDLRFGATYFEDLLSRFLINPKLGIASGVYVERSRGGRLAEVKMPAYHSAGACKVVRRECWENIGGFVEHRGWDTVDEIRAMSKGWITRHFPELKMEHLKPEGSGIGLLRTQAMLGEVYYLTGGGIAFFAFKLLRRLTHRPLFLGSCAMAFGYLSSLLSRSSRLVTSDEARHYRSLLHSRVRDAFLKAVDPSLRFRRRSS